MNKQQLASKIWESANQMRSKIEANEYKDYILGFIFYKYLSDYEVKRLKNDGFTDEDLKKLTEENVDIVQYVQSTIGYFISYKDLFSTWLEMGSDFDVSNVQDALSAFSRLINPTHKKVFEGIFATLDTGLSKLGDTSNARTKAISGLLQLIKDIPMDGKQDYDVLGFIYEYLIGMFAANAGKKAGEFYTPHEVSLLMSEIVANHLKDNEKINIYDPTSGSGSLLINIGKSVAKYLKDSNDIKYYAQELKQNTYNLTRMNLVMRGILPDNIMVRNADTLEDDWPYFDEADPVSTYDPLYVDAVVSNPPYSQKWEPDGKANDPRYSRFGLAPKSKADYAFLLHDLFHLKPTGIMTIVLPHGVLFRGGEEGEIRKNLIENNHVDAIIGLPANIFFGTGIPTIIMVLKQKRENTDTLIIDASKGFEKVGKNNKLRASDIKRIVDAVVNRADISKFSRKVSKDEIRKNDYNLNIPRYVDSSDATEKWDIYASMFGGIPMSEINELASYWDAFPNLKDSLFEFGDTPYAKVVSDDLIPIIKEHLSVQQFIENYKGNFSNFNSYLKSELLDKAMTLNNNQELAILTNDIFNRLSNVKLIDKYEAYQILSDNWDGISTDIEMIQTEGFETVKKVDPNMVLKNKEEVQEGWIGHILPFELVQKTMLKEEYNSLKQKENRLSEISSEYEEILDTLSEDDKQDECINDNGDAFINANVNKKAKTINEEIKQGVVFDEESFESKIIKISSLIAEEKALKTQIKKDSDKLHDKTKVTIEGLSDEQAYMLLEKKWIEPLVAGIIDMPNAIIQKLTDEISNLCEKYSSTLSSVEEQIQETETQLSLLIDELTGNEYDLKGLEEFQLLMRGI